MKPWPVLAMFVLTLDHVAKAASLTNAPLGGVVILAIVCWCARLIAGDIIILFPWRLAHTTLVAARGGGGWGLPEARLGFWGLSFLIRMVYIFFPRSTVTRLPISGSATVRSKECQHEL